MDVNWKSFDCSHLWGHISRDDNSSQLVLFLTFATRTSCSLLMNAPLSHSAGSVVFRLSPANTSETQHTHILLLSVVCILILTTLDNWALFCVELTVSNFGDSFSPVIY